MKCSKCQYDNLANANFCSACGASFQASKTPQTSPATAPNHNEAFIEEGVRQLSPEETLASITPAPLALYAGFWKRFAAYIIDTLIITFADYALLGVGLIFEAFNEGIFLSAYLVVFFMNLLYFVVMESSKKQATLGKMALGIIVVDSNGRRIGFWRAFARYFARTISAIPLLLGYMLAGWTQKKQALHDMICGTLVINKNAETLLTNLQNPLEGSVMPAKNNGLPTWAIVLIVLGVTVPILGVVASIAVPAYYEYITRVKVSEGLSLANQVAPCMEQSIYTHDYWPESLQELDTICGTTFEKTIPNRYVESLEVYGETGEVSVTFNDEVADVKGLSLYLTPAITEDEDGNIENIEWTCHSDEIQSKYLPLACHH